MLFDSHAHLDMPQFDADRAAVIERLAPAGVSGVLTLGTDLASSEAARALARAYPGVYPAVGFHPHEAARLDDAAMARLRLLAREPGVVALGEIGLDFYRDHAPRAVQVSALRRQLDLAAELGLPVALHSRAAEAALLEVLQDWTAGQPAGLRGVMHCFGGDWPQAAQLIELGFMIAIAGPVTYPRSEGLAELARRVPWEWLLVETDSPYLAPQPQRGRRNEPAFVVAVAEQIARLRGVSVEVVAEHTTRDACRLLRLG